MQNTKKSVLAVASVAGYAMFLLASFHSVAQDKPKREAFQAQAMGQGTQMGHTLNVTDIAEYPTPEERQILVEAFEKAGSEGLFNALNKMPSKGRIAISGTLGYDVSFVREIPTEGGRKIRVLTNRPITFGEAWTNSGYNLSTLEFDLSNQKDKSTGLLLPACQFKIDKKTKELIIENYQNPWKLVNILDPGDERGYPTAETVQKAYDADLSRAIQAYRFFYWSVSMAGLFRSFENYGPIENKTFFILEGKPNQELVTSNSDAPYAALPLDLHGGPITVELPPGPLIGIANDRNFQWVMDFGLPGPDGGRGGKHIILPPGYKGKIPSGYYVSMSKTYRVFLIIRSRPLGGDIKGALARVKTVKVQPLNRRAGRTKWINVTERSFDATSLAWETNIKFWEELHRIINTEPDDARFRNNYDELAVLGIVKDKPFAPDARMKEILEKAAKLASAQMNQHSNEDDDEYPDVVHHAELRHDNPRHADSRNESTDRAGHCRELHPRRNRLGPGRG